METSKKFPVSKLLLLYYKHPRQLYLDYFRNLKLLRDWLGSLDYELPQETLEPLHQYQISYEIQELAKHLGCSQELIKYHLDRIHHDRIR